MLPKKRIIIATICGFVFGIICMMLGSMNPDVADKLTISVILMGISVRTLTGFTIGISALRMSW